MKPSDATLSRVMGFWTPGSDNISPQIGTQGYSLPNPTALSWTPIGDPSSDNWLFSPSNRSQTFHIEFGGSGNVVVVGAGSTLGGRISSPGSDATIVFGDNTGPGSAGNFNVFGSGTGGLFFLGAGSTSNNTSAWIQGDNARVVIGEDCMFAHGIVLRSGDDHSIFDIASGEWLNQPQPVYLEPHVWICPEVHLLKGTSIGFGSIVGSMAVVNRDFPRFSLVAGQPARILKSGVSWDRPQSPRPHVVAGIAAPGNEITRLARSPEEELE